MGIINDGSFKGAGVIEAQHKSLESLLNELNQKIKDNKIYDEENSGYYIKEFYYSRKNDEIRFIVEEDESYGRGLSIE